MTVSNGLIFLMASIFRDSDRKKKTKEEIEAEERAKDTAAALGLLIGTVIAMAEKYREDYTEHPERYGIRQRDYGFGQRMVM